jgi:NAD(P)H-nitrite reductase large subunit
LPKYISGKIKKESLYVSPLESYEQNGIKLRTGQRVVDIDLEKKAIVLDHKEIVSYSGLVIAVGGTPRIPEPLLLFKELMFTLKTIEDSALWMEELSKIDSVLMIGGDLTSFAVTKALLHLQKEVYFVLDENAFWPLRYTEALFEEASERLRKKGVKVLKSKKFNGFARTSKKTITAYMDGQKMDVGMIGAFFGLVPNVQFLVRSGLTIDRGLLVDEHLSTGFEGVFATGDCAQIYHPDIKDYWVSIGHDNAVALGHTAALNLLGAEYRADVDNESIFDVQGIHVNTSWWSEF